MLCPSDRNSGWHLGEVFSFVLDDLLKLFSLHSLPDCRAYKRVIAGDHELLRAKKLEG